MGFHYLLQILIDSINQSINQFYFRHKPIEKQENKQTDDKQTTETTKYRLQITETYTEY